MADVKQVASGAKLESIGTVKTVVGTVKAVDASGAERILQAGDHVYANETIVTADGGLVLIEFADGTHLDLGSASNIVLNTDVFNPANAEAKGEELTAEQIQEMIARGEDPTAVTEATAAGAGSGDEGGSSFIVVDYNNTQGNVTSGFDTQGIPGPESTTFTELPPVEDETVPAPASEVEAVPTTEVTTVAVDEDDIFPDWWNETGLNWAEEFGADVGEFTIYSTVGIGAIDGNTSNADEGEGDALGDPIGPWDGYINGSENPIPSPTNVSGKLNVDFGADGAGNITFNTPSQELTSGGEPVQYWISDDGHTIVGYVNVTGEYSEEFDGESYSYAKVVFTAQITDAATGDYTFTLYGSLDHTAGDAENDLLVNLTYIVTDADGDTAEGLLTVNVDDDSPIINEYYGSGYDEVQSENASVPTAYADEDDLENGNHDYAGGDDYTWNPSWVSLPVNFGADGPAAENPIVLSGDSIVDQYGNPLMSGGEAVQYVWDAESQTLTGYVGSVETPVFTLTVEYVYSFGAYVSFNLTGTLDHPLNDVESPEDNLVFNISYTATDFDGDSVTGTLAVDVDDDSPVAGDTFNSVDEGAETSGVLSFMAGADGAIVTHINGVAIEFDAEGWSQEFEGAHGVIKVKADGTYNFTAQPDDLLDSDGSDNFSFTVTDGDGDTSTASLDVTVNDVVQPITIKVFAVVDGELVDASSVAEGETATYVAHAVDPDGNIIADATGNVDITFTNGTAGSADYTSATTTVALGVDFTADALDDYLADNGETYTVSASNYSDAATYEDVAYGDVVTTTIIDDTNPDTPEDPDEPSQDAVTIQVFAVLGEDEGGNLILGDANSVPEGATATYVAYLVDPNGNVITGATGTVDITFTNGTAGSSDYASTTTTVALGTTFTADAADDYVADNGETFTVGASNYSDAASYEEVTYGDVVTTTIIDDTNPDTPDDPDEPDQDTTTVTLNDVTVDEGSGTATISATVSNPVTDSDLVITLDNGATITIAVGDTTGVSTPFAVQGDDPYVDGENYTVAIDSTSGGNYEALDTSDTATVTVEDTINTITASLSTSTTEVSEDGGSIVYTITLTGPDGMTIAPQTDLVFNLANGEQVTIEAGATSGSYTKVYADGDITDQTSITNSIAGVASGGSEYEDLDTAGTTEVDVDYGVTITGLTPQANGGDVIVDEDDLADGTDGSDSTTAPGTFTITTPDGVQSLTIGGVAIITNGVFTAATITSALGNTLNVTGYNAGTGVVTYSYTLNDNTTTHAAGNGENSVYEDFAVVVTDTDNDTDSATLSVQIVDDVPVTTFAEDTSVSLASGSDTGSLGITIGADLTGASVTLLIAGDEANGQQVMDSNGNPVTSGGDSLYYFADGNGGIYAATEEGGDSVLEVTPAIAVDGTTSYTVNVTGLIDQNTDTDTSSIAVTVIEYGSETVQLTGDFTAGSLASGNYKPQNAPIGGTLDGYDSEGNVVGSLSFSFRGYSDSDSTTGQYVFGTAAPVSVSGQNVGVSNNMIDNKNSDGDGEVLKLTFSKTVTDLSMLFDQLDTGETAYYSIDQGAHWIAVSGTSQGGSQSSDEMIDTGPTSGFTELWIRGGEGSSFGILINSLQAEWQETVPTETEHNYNVSVIDVTGENQTVTLSAQASDGDSDLSDLVSFDTTLDSAVDYDAVSVSGSTISNFSVEQGDQLDFSAIFNDMNMDAATLASGGYLTVNVDSATNTATISVDLDASSGSAYTPTQVVTLTNLDSGITAAQIINQIITHENP